MNFLGWITSTLRNAYALIVAAFWYNLGKQASKQKTAETTLEEIDKANKAINTARSSKSYADFLRGKYNIK